MDKVGNGKLVLIQWWVFLYQGAREWGHTIRGTMVETDGRHTKPLSTLRHRPLTSDNYISLQHPVPHSPAWISFIHYPGFYTLIFQQYQHHRCTTKLDTLWTSTSVHKCSSINTVKQFIRKRFNKRIRRQCNGMWESSSALLWSWICWINSTNVDAYCMSNSMFPFECFLSLPWKNKYTDSLLFIIYLKSYVRSINNLLKELKTSGCWHRTKVVRNVTGSSLNLP